MKLFKSILFFLLLSFQLTVFSQPVITPGGGIGNLTIGSSPDEVVWELGFKGLKLTKEGVPDLLKNQADILGVDFDYVYNYQHIMAVPVSTVYFKNDKVVIIVVSSYPQYNEILCLGIKTKEGVNFWDDEGDMKKVYGKNYQSRKTDHEFHYYREKGIGFLIDDQDIRTITIFKP